MLEGLLEDRRVTGESGGKSVSAGPQAEAEPVAQEARKVPGDYFEDTTEGEILEMIQPASVAVANIMEERRHSGGVSVVHSVQVTTCAGLT